MLTGTGTLLSKMIGIYTGSRMNHVSIAFDEELNEMYSFGRKYQSNPFIAGFIKENVRSKLFQEANCAIYSCKVSEVQAKRIESKIHHIEMNKSQYRYNFIGLFGVAFNREIDRKYAFFCSQFVAMIMNEGNIPLFAISPGLVQPRHFMETPYLEEIYNGGLQSYLYAKRGEELPIDNSAWKLLAPHLLNQLGQLIKSKLAK